MKRCYLGEAGLAFSEPPLNFTFKRGASKAGAIVGTLSTLSPYPSDAGESR